MPRVKKSSLIISILIAVCGWLSATWLSRVDQDLRVIYSENTLAATGLGHIYADLIRYRTTILRAIEADSERDFKRIRSSLPVIRARMEGAVDRYIQASNRTKAAKNVDRREIGELREAHEKLVLYLAASDHTIEVLEQMWRSVNPAERGRHREEAERYAATVAGPKLIDATIALDELLTVVGRIAGEVRKEADDTLRFMTLTIMLVSMTLASAVLLSS